MTVTTPAMRTAFHLSTVLPVRTVQKRQVNEPPPPVKHKELTAELRERIRTLRRQGLSLKAVAKIVRRSKATVSKYSR